MEKWTAQYFEVHYMDESQGVIYKDKKPRWMNFLGERFKTIKESEDFIATQKSKEGKRDIQAVGSITVDSGIVQPMKYRIVHVEKTQIY